MKVNHGASEIKFEIKEQIATLSTSSKGWSKQFNLIAWNGNQAKFDIRDWNETGDKCGKGITMTVEELKALKDALNKLDI